MDQGFFTDEERSAIKDRLTRELGQELPPGMDTRIGTILNAALNFHAPVESRISSQQFDFRSLAGEELLPKEGDRFGAGDYLKLSQVFERSLVGLINSAELSSDEKSRFISDIQGFFDGFDTALLKQLEEELMARGLLREAATREEDNSTRAFHRLGFSQELADEMTDPVLLTNGNDIAYANPSAVAFFGDMLERPCWGPHGFLGESSIGLKSGTGEWMRRRMCLPASDPDCRETLVSWKTINIEGELVSLVMFPSSGRDIDTSSRIKSLKREGQRFKGLYRLSKELISGTNLGTLAKRICKELSAVFHYDALLLHVNHLELSRAYYHLATAVPKAIPDLMLENSMTFLGGFSQGVKEDVEKQMLNSKNIDTRKKGPPESGSLFILPLAFRDEFYGTIGVYRTRDIPVDDDDLHLFSAFTNQLTLALKDMIAVDSMRKLLRDNQEQLELARMVQTGLLPHAEDYDRLRFHTRFRPAAGVSGDFYHFYSTREMEGLVIGDASGHGISASLIMAAAVTTFHDVCSGDDCDPASMLEEANSALKKALSEDFFVVACTFMVDRETLKATYSSAGQLGPILLKKDGRTRFLKAAGTPLGMFEETPEYRIRSVQLNKGDRLLFFTDGVVEARNSDGKLFGIDKLRKQLKGYASLKSDALLDSLMADIKGFSPDSNDADDMTLILAEVK